jgi:hypothetical protein
MLLLIFLLQEEIANNYKKAAKAIAKPEIIRDKNCGRNLETRVIVEILAIIFCTTAKCNHLDHIDDERFLMP